MCRLCNVPMEAVRMGPPDRPLSCLVCPECDGRTSEVEGEIGDYDLDDIEENDDDWRDEDYLNDLFGDD